ncbi:MAG: hypothetical protein HRU19_31670 [Pseudobacteriovorax sp.]|nr:hypothetical protein [Pseudobacteriovorax sp.]
MKYKEVTIFLLVSVFAVFLNYCLFIGYLGFHTRTLIMSWETSETIAIQQGNLYSSFMKNQKMIAASSFSIESMSLFSLNEEKFTKEASIGKKVSIPEQRDISPGEAEYSLASIFKVRLVYRLSKNSNFFIVTEASSIFLQSMFLLNTLAILLLLTIFIFILSKINKSDLCPFRLDLTLACWFV